MTITKSKCVSFSFSSRHTDPTLLLIFSLQQEINLEWPYNGIQQTVYRGLQVGQIAKLFFNRRVGSKIAFEIFHIHTQSNYFPSYPSTPGL